MCKQDLAYILMTSLVFLCLVQCCMNKMMYVCEHASCALSVCELRVRGWKHGEGTDWEVIERRLLFIVLLTRACWHHPVRALPLTPRNKTTTAFAHQTGRYSDCSRCVSMCFDKVLLLVFCCHILKASNLPLLSVVSCSFIWKLELISCTHKSYDLHCIHYFYVIYSYSQKPVLVLFGH